MDQPFLGHKAPRPGRARLYWCPACWTSVGPTLFKAFNFTSDPFFNVKPRHVLESCPAVNLKREELGIKAFLDGCLQAGRSMATAFKLFILGLDEDRKKVDLETHMKRGASLHELTEAWLSTWEDPEIEV